MVAHIDEFKDRFRVGPICRVLAASLDCGFITPRGYRMFRSRPVSRMAARHEALARDILEIHADFFMAVYGYRKTHAQLLARGWDPAEIGRDQVMNVMRESGIRGVRRGRTPVTTKPAKGAGGRPDLVERGFEAEAPNRLHVADITYVRMANGSFGYTAFAADVFARRIVGWACAVFLQVGVHSMGTIFRQHRRLVSSGNCAVGTRRPFFLGYLVMRACSLRYEPPSNLTSLPWCTVRSINAAAMFLSPSTRPQPENSMFVV